jgi:ubiquinone/menaquinone biosynthesis C-methylase UbiE
MAHKSSTNNQPNEDELMKGQMEKMVDSYDSYMSKVTLGREQALREMTVDLAQVKPGDSVLEIGCGTGSLTLAAKRRAGSTGEAFGVDLIPGMITASQKKAAQASEQISFQPGSIDNLPFPDNRFDVALCSFMIFHMSEDTRRKGMGEIWRVLKPRGRLLILDMAAPTQPVQKAIARLLFGGMLHHELRELLPLMDASGFPNAELGPANFKILGLSVLGFVRGSARKI